jgi:hypothetical protein
MARLVDRRELLAAVEQQPDRPSRRTGEGGGVCLEVEVALAAETAAERRHDHADVALRQSERLGDAGARTERRLRRAPDGEPPALPLGEGGVRLDRDGVRHVGLVPLRQDQIRLGQARLDVSFHLRHEAPVVPAADDPGPGLVALPVGVDEHRALDQCSLGVEHCLERLVLHADQATRLARRLRLKRRDSGQDLAFEADDVGREQRPVAHEWAVADVGHVVPRKHGEDTGQRPRGGHVEPNDPCVWNAGEQQLAVNESRRLQVGDVARGSCRLLEGVLPDETGADGAGQGGNYRTLPASRHRVAGWPTGSTLSRSRSWGTSSPPRRTRWASCSPVRA